MLKKILVILSFLGIASVAHAATVFNSNQVGANPSNGLFLKTNGATSTWASGTPTTTINGVQGPTFTFSIVSTSSASSITTSSAQLFLNLLTYTSSSDITISPTGTLVFASRNISQFTNNSNYITLLSLSASSPLSYNTSTGAFSCSTCITTTQATTTIAVGNTTFTGPNFVASSSGIISLSTSTSNTFIYGLSTSTLNTNVSALGYVTSTASAAGTSSDVQLNQSGVFAADTGIFTYSTSSKQLALNATSSSVKIGSSTNFFFSTSTVTQTFTATGIASFTVPSNVTGTIKINVIGAQGAAGALGTFGLGGSATGTLSLASSTPGTVFWYQVGASGLGGAQGLGGGTCSTGDPTAGTGGTQTTAPTGGIAASPNCTNGQSGASIFDGAGGAPGRAGNAAPGGQSSWISTASTFSTSTFIMVGGGGGGGGGDGGLGSSKGGDAGGLTGSNGIAQTSGNAGGAGGGGAASSFRGSLTATSTASTATTAQVQLTYTIITRTFDSTSSYALAVGGHIITGGGLTTLSACGTVPSVAGNDIAGVITTGSGTVTSCSMTFANAYPNPPVCVLSDSSTSITPDVSAVSTSSVTFSFSSTLTSGKIYYHCLGY